MLFPIRPRAYGESAKRAMFVGEGLWKILTSSEGDDAWDKRVGELQADLERFVDGQPIDPKYLFLLYPAHDNVWEIRSVADVPSIRVMGLFAERDVFVATNYALREALGEWQSREWKCVKRMARAIWRCLFITYQPMHTNNVKDLVSGALDGKYFKG